MHCAFTALLLYQDLEIEVLVVDRHFASEWLISISILMLHLVEVLVSRLDGLSDQDQPTANQQQHSRLRLNCYSISRVQF